MSLHCWHEMFVTGISLLIFIAAETDANEPFPSNWYTRYNMFKSEPSCSNADVSYIYSAGYWLDSQSWHRLCWVRYFSVPTDKRWAGVSMRAILLPSTSLTIHLLFYNLAPPSSGYQHEAGSKRLCLTLASCWFLAWIILRPRRRRRHIPPKRRLTFNGLHGVISMKTEFFIRIILSLSTLGINKRQTWIEFTQIYNSVLGRVKLKQTYNRNCTATKLPP
jgi:hypothetical protein